MEHLFLECTVRAALLVASTALVLHVMRVKSAAARHGVWTSVVLMMLILPIWTVWGPKAPLRLLPPLGQTGANEAIIAPDTLSTAFVPLPLLSTREAVLLGVYTLGLSLLLLRLAIGTVRARRLVRDALLQDGMRVSSLCAAPVTVGFFRPTVIVPEQWRQWSQAQLDAVLTHEDEHARRRDSLVQWLALLNRAVFWFHPVAWWLERRLSALAEEACDNVVLTRGHSPREYAEYLIDMARSVTRSGARLNVAGMAMPGSFLPQRIRQIMEGGQAPCISRKRMAFVIAACAITFAAFGAGTLDQAQQNAAAQSQRGLSGAPLATKFVLGDLKIEGDVHDRDGVRARVLKEWQNREYDDSKKLADDVMTGGIRKDFQERGYFKVFAHQPVSQPLSLIDGNQRILLIASVTEGDQFRLSSLTIQNATPDRALSIPVATLRDQFHLRDGDVFKVTEIRAGLDRLRRLYGARGLYGFTAVPNTQTDDASHRVAVIIRITEAQLTP